jgi:hypothetical protein
MKKLLGTIVLVLYILSSQFVFKARATSDWDTFSQEEYCVSKKVDNFGSKRSCRKKTHSANIDCDVVQIPVLFSFFHLNALGGFVQDKLYISSQHVL